MYEWPAATSSRGGLDLKGSIRASGGRRCCCLLLFVCLLFFVCCLLFVVVPFAGCASMYVLMWLPRLVLFLLLQPYEGAYKKTKGKRWTEEETRK